MISHSTPSQLISPAQTVQFGETSGSLSTLMMMWSSSLPVRSCYDFRRSVMGGGKRKHPEGGVRINYLQQARHHVLRMVGGPVGRMMAASMGHQMVAVGKKSQVRLGGDIKRTLCKVGLSAVLLC